MRRKKAKASRKWQPPKEKKVSKILDDRINESTEKVEYLIKWHRISANGNSWESSDILSEDMIEKYQKKKLEPRNEKPIKRKNLWNKDEDKSSDEENEGMKTEALDLKVEKILGATMQNDDLYYLVKWKNYTTSDLVNERQLNASDPQAVIQFLSQHISWKKSNVETYNIEGGDVKFDFAKILGIVFSENDELFYIVECCSCRKAKIMKEENVHIGNPRLVIQYLRTMVVFDEESEEE